MPAWGFEYSTVAFQWLKQTSKGNPASVMGYYFMNSVELCLLGVRGKPTKIHAGLRTKIHSLVEEVRVRHSQKPEEVPRRIEIAFPRVKRLELFARSEREGWDVWGNEVECSNSHLRRILG